MGCEGSKPGAGPAAPPQKPQQQQQQEARPIDPPLPPRTFERELNGNGNGMGGRRASSEPAFAKHTGSSRRGSSGDYVREDASGGRAWRFVNTAFWVPADLGQNTTVLDPIEETIAFDNTVKGAFAGGDRGYTFSGGEFRPPLTGDHSKKAASQGVKPTDVISAATKLSKEHPAVAAYTLASPLCNAGAHAMLHHTGGGGDTCPFGVDDDTAAEGRHYASHRAFQTLLHAQLLSLPKHEGVCFKFAPFGLGGAYTPSNVVTWVPPTPTSKSISVAARGLATLPGGAARAPAGATDFTKGWTCLVIQSRSGRSVEQYSVEPGEEEVVFLANTQFRTSHRVSSAVKAMVTRGVAGRLPSGVQHVDFLLLTEVRLVVWRDVLEAMDEVERAAHRPLVNLLEQATARAENDRCYAWDVVSQSHILGAPMETLPPRGAGGATVVHLCADVPESLGLLKLVTYHLSPSDIDETNSDGRSPMHLALCTGNRAAVLHLLTKGASVASLGSLADTALATAIQFSARVSQRALVERVVAEVDNRDADTVFGSRAVVTAIGALGKLAEAKPFFELILSRLEKVHHLKYLNLSGVVRAACEARGTEPAFIRWLVEEGSISVKDIGDAVAACMDSHNYGLLKTLKDLGVSLDAADANGRCAVHIAASRCDVDGLSALQEAGADLAVVDASGWAPAHDAAYRGHKEVLSLLARWRIPLDKGDVDGCTPLWWAADTGRQECVAFLLQQGANASVADATGTTAMMIAAYNGHADVVRTLAEENAAVDRQNNEGQSAVWLAAAVGSVACMKELKAKGASLGLADTKGWTAAHIAAQEGWVEALVYLGQYCSAVLQQKNHQHLTPLHLAVSKSRFRCVAYLISAGVSIAVKGQDSQLGAGTMPLHIAASKESFTNNACLPLLVNADTINASCTCGSPLDVAHMFGRYYNANAIREQGGESTRQPRPDEDMAEVPDNVKDVQEVVFKHPATLPEKNMPGAVIRITTTDGGRFIYSLNGEDRPPFRRIHLYHGSHGLALKFPDAGQTGRQVYLPVTGVREILAGLLGMADTINISLDLRTEFKTMAQGGHTSPLRRTLTSMRMKSTARQDSKPSFASVSYVSEAQPYAFSTIKAVAQYVGGEEGQSVYAWYRRQIDADSWVPVKQVSNAYDESGSSYAYYAIADDLGCQLKTVCTPVRKDGVNGTPVETKPITLLWPPHLGCTVVSKIADGAAAIRVDCEIAGETFNGAILQLVENQLKVKRAGQSGGESLATGVMDSRHRLRCVILASDTPMFDIRGLSAPVTIKTETRVDRDFLVSLIRVWSACCDPQLTTAMLTADFEKEWAAGMPTEGDATWAAARDDTVWHAFEAKTGMGQLYLSETFPRNAAQEARQTLATLRMGFATGQMRRPPTKSTRT